MIAPKEVRTAIIDATRITCPRINDFSRQVLITRGGRIGSGMGSLLEALWGFYVNQVLQSNNNQALEFEFGWFSSHGYNDFACILRDVEWNPETRTGELLRVEAKSMNIEADESKGHFDELIDNLGEWDLLLVLLWSWELADDIRVYPHIRDYFIGSALAVAILRDRLHIARGGTFVEQKNCPDGCNPAICPHHGEPLNKEGNRERRSGPETRRPKGSSYAANFGGLLRMLQTSSVQDHREFCKVRAENDVAHNYISFIHRNYPDRELSQYKKQEWLTLAEHLGVSTRNTGKQLKIEELVNLIRSVAPDYQDHLREIHTNNSQLSLLDE